MKKLITAIVLCALCAGIFYLIEARRTAPTTKCNATGAIAVIEARRSIRNYTTEAVERETLQRIAEYGILAPSARNAQNWEVRIVDSKEWIDRCTAAYVKSIEGTDAAKWVIGEGFRNMFRNAPAVIFVAVHPEKGYGYDDVHVGLLSQNIMLAAEELGLGTCFLGSPLAFLNSEHPEGSKFLAEIGFSEGYRLRCAIAIGHPDDKPKPQERDKSVIRFVE